MIEKLQKELTEANWYYEHYLKNIQEYEIKLRAMKLLIKEIEVKIANISNGEKNELEE